MHKIVTFIMINYKKYSILIGTFFLCVLGLIMTSWIIWSRFLRERVIRDIPDELLTEYRFWILLYICLIYFYTVKQLVKPKRGNIILSEILSEMVDILYVPLKRLDHLLKYNSFTVNTYNRIINFILKRILVTESNYIVTFMFLCQILPRICLVSVLLCDVFYFFRIEYFYKIILIGIIPFVYRYMVYCLKDFVEYKIMLINEHYDLVQITRIDDDDEKKKKEYMKYYGGNESSVQMKMTLEKRKDPWHNKHVSVKEYVELKSENYYEHTFKEVQHEYIGSAYNRDEIYRRYALEQYNDINAKLVTKDYEELEKLFKELMPQIIEIKHLLRITIDWYKEWKIIKYPKIAIFTLYGICWSFVLGSSYYHYPVEFNMFKYFLQNVMLYIMLPEDPFFMMYSHSQNVNLVTIENITSLIKSIWKNLTTVKR